LKFTSGMKGSNQKTQKKPDRGVGLNEACKSRVVREGSFAGVRKEDGRQKSAKRVQEVHGKRVHQFRKKKAREAGQRGKGSGASSNMV